MEYVARALYEEKLMTLDSRDLRTIAVVLDRITGHQGCTVVEPDRVVARAALAPVLATVLGDTEADKTVIFAAVMAREADPPSSVSGLNQVNMYSYSGGCVVRPGGTVLSSLGIPLRWWAGPLAHAADLILETMLGTAAWHSLRSHPERLFEGVGVNAGVMQNCPVAGSEGSDEGDPSGDDAHRPLAKIGATIKEHGHLPDASALAEASTLQACAVARMVATGWVERSHGGFAKFTSPQGTRLAVRPACHPHIGWGVQLLLFEPGTHEDPSNLAADLAERDWSSRRTGLSIGAWAETVDHVEYRAFIPVRIIEAVPTDASEQFWSEVVTSVASRTDVVQGEHSISVEVPEWEYRPLPNEEEARTSWRLRPITDDGLSDESDHKVILTEFGGATVDPYWVLRYAERLTDEDCSSPSAYGYLRWADREMGLGLASWSAAPLPSPDTLDTLQAARAQARKKLASPE